jgi:ribosomal protein S18 acetylase RimI-like enzyme
MKRELLTTYMEMTAPPAGARVPCPLTEAEITREAPPPETYLAIWRSVGDPLGWDGRLQMSRDDLAAFLRRATTHLYILRLGSLPVGLCEFEGVGGAEVELTNFGLIPSAQGRRLGPYLLDDALRRIWALPTRRVWLHTDTEDHPKAIPTYERAGFAIYGRRLEPS